jgi:hypothetical protein
VQSVLKILLALCLACASWADGQYAVYGEVCHTGDIADTAFVGIATYPSLTSVASAAQLNCGLSIGAPFVTTSTGSITIGALGGGLYKVVAVCSFSGTTNATYHMVVTKGGSNAMIEGERKFATGTDTNGLTAQGLLRLVSTDVLTLAFGADAPAKDVTINHMRLVVQRIAP